MPTYVLPGDPGTFVRIDGDYKWKLRDKEMRWAHITLSSQHQEKPLYTSPIKVDILLFFPIPSKGPREHAKHGDIYVGKPLISSLTRFFDLACRGILWEDSDQVYLHTVNRKYDTFPRAEIHITEFKT